MRSLIRLLVRVAASVLLGGLLVGVPAIVLLTVGAPWPTMAQWHEAWRSHAIDADVAVRIGAALFLVLWAWFAVTAVGKLGTKELAEKVVARGQGDLVDFVMRKKAARSRQAVIGKLHLRSRHRARVRPPARRPFSPRRARAIRS